MDLTPAQSLQLRQIAIRREYSGTLTGRWQGGAAALVAVLRQYGFEVLPGYHERVAARHPLGRIYEFRPDGASWSFGVAFDPTQGLRLAPPESEEEAAARKRMGGRKAKTEARTQMALFGQATQQARQQADESMWWDGRTLVNDGRFLGFDIETTLISEGEFPQVVLASAATETGDGVLLEPEMIPDFIRLHLEREPTLIWCGWNIADLDFPTLEYRLPGFTQEFHDRIIRQVHLGYFYDSMLFLMLLDIARYGQLFKPGGKIAPGPWADKGGYYSLAASCERLLGFRPPKGEGISFGDFLGRPREISEDQAAYALGDSMINAALQKAMHDDPFSFTVAKRAKEQILAVEGQVRDSMKSAEWHEPVEDAQAAADLAPNHPLIQADESNYEPLVRECGLVYGWQTHTIQFLGTYGASWGNRNGIGVDVTHTVEFIEQLEVDVAARLEMLGGEPGLLLIEETVNKTGQPVLNEKMGLLPRHDVDKWTDRLRTAILDWERGSWERDKKLEIIVARVPRREFYRPFRGLIRTARHFPTYQQLETNAPREYLVASAVTDDYDPFEMAERFKISERKWGDLADAGTKTGQSFQAGDVIRWTGNGWVVLAGDEAAAVRAEILRQGVTDLTMGKLVAANLGAPDPGEEDEEEAEGALQEERRAFKGYAYPFTTAQGTNATAIDAYIRECVLPLPPVKFYSPSRGQIDAIPTRGYPGEFYSDLVDKVGRKRDQWLMAFGVNDVDDIPDPILREYFMLKRAEKELGAVKTYLPGYVRGRQQLRKLPIRSLLRALHLEDVKRSRIYPSTKALGAATGRSGMSNPNLQQVSQAKRHRGAFVPMIDARLVVTDIGGAEMATQAEIFKHRYGKLRALRGVRLLADYMNEGFDPHLLTGMQFRFPEQRDVWMPILEDPYLRAVKMAPNDEVKKRTVDAMLEVYPDVTFDMSDSGEDIAKGIWISMLASALGEEKQTIKNARQEAKVPNFGIPGGMQANRIISVAEVGYGLKITLEEAFAAIQAWRTIFPDGSYWLADGAQHLVRNAPLPAPQWGYYDNCFTLTGRLRGQLGAAEPIPEWKLRKMRESGMREEPYDEGLNEWHNTQFQGLAADGAKLGLYLAMREGLRITNFVHDEIGYEAPLGRLDEYRQAAQDALRIGMSMVMTMVKVSIGASVLKRWQK